jgi:hypothetical protein
MVNSRDHRNTWERDPGSDVESGGIGRVSGLGW